MHLNIPNYFKIYKNDMGTFFKIYYVCKSLENSDFDEQLWKRRTPENVEDPSTNLGHLEYGIDIYQKT